MQASAERSSPEPIAAEGLLHPVALAAIALLIFNDHFLKAAYPGVVTGKISDFAGLVFFPLLIVSAWEVLLWLRGRRPAASQRVLAVAIGATAVLFGSVKLVPVVSDAVAGALGAGQALVGLAGTSRIVTDPTDLVALPALFVAYAIGMRRVRRVGLP